MSFFRAVVTGDKETREKLDEAGRNLEPTRFKGRMIDALRVVKDTMKKEAPKDRGGLKESIEITVTTSGDNTIGEVGPTAFYSRFIEEGTGTFAGHQPYHPPGRRIHPWAVAHGFINGFQLSKAIFKAGGTKPNPFVQRTFDKTKDEIVKRLGDVVVEIMK